MKINIQKPVTILHTNKEHVEKEISKANPFTTASKNA
jgi:hypothetical protein